MLKIKKGVLRTKIQERDYELYRQAGWSLVEEKETQKTENDVPKKSTKKKKEVEENGEENNII